MNEYKFLGSGSFRSEHVKAKTLRAAYVMTRKWYLNLDSGTRARFGVLRGKTYQWCQDGAYVMSGWLHSRDPKLKDVGEYGLCKS